MALTTYDHIAGAQSHSVEQREPVRSDHCRSEQLFQTQHDDARGNQRQHFQFAEHRRSGAQGRIENRRRCSVRDRGRQKDLQVRELRNQGFARQRGRMDAVISQLCIRRFG